MAKDIKVLIGYILGGVYNSFFASLFISVGYSALEIIFSLVGLNLLIYLSIYLQLGFGDIKND